MAVEFAAELQRFGLVDIVLWMLSFAIIYGVLSQVGKEGVPAHKGARTIIAIVLAFMVLFSTPTNLAQMISRLSSDLLLIILGLLSLIIFIEAVGIKVHKKEFVEGKEIYTGEEVSIFEEYGKYFAVALMFIALIIFISAGGLEWIGLSDVLGFGKINVVGAGLFIMIILAVLWMIAEK